MVRKKKKVSLKLKVKAGDGQGKRKQAASRQTGQNCKNRHSPWDSSQDNSNVSRDLSPAKPHDTLVQGYRGDTGRQTVRGTREGRDLDSS